jgi:putative ATP-dependent endonuclease of OLD family
MARVRAVEIDNFRSIKRLEWFPEPGINCIIGPGDSGKSTVLDAIDLCLGARRHIQFTDADFHRVVVDDPIRIAVTVGELPAEMKRLEAYGPFLRGFRAASRAIEDEPSFDTEVILTHVLSVDSDLEPTWTLYSDRASSEGTVRGLLWNDRTRLAPTRLGGEDSHQLEWRKGSVLNRLSAERADVTQALAKIVREARHAFGDQAEGQLGEVLELVSEAAEKLGVTAAEGARALLDAGSVSSTMGAISLHTAEGVPLSSLGLGSARLLVAGLQRRAAAESSMILVDELEHGLEPHRIIRFVDELGAKEPMPPLQVFATTHSPVVLRELSGGQLSILRATAEAHECTLVSTDNDVQGTLRTCPEAFLASQCIVCEGATEEGLVRGLDQWFVSNGRQSIRARGVSLVNAQGVTKILSRAEPLQRLKYRVMILRDDDQRPEIEDEQAFQNAGGLVISWPELRTLEKELFYSLPDEGVQQLLAFAVEVHGEDLIAANTLSAGSTIDQCRTSCNAPERIVLGTAASAKPGWFKTVSRMEEAALTIIGPHLAQSDPVFKALVEQVFTWASGA